MGSSALMIDFLRGLILSPVLITLTLRWTQVIVLLSIHIFRFHLLSLAHARKDLTIFLIRQFTQILRAENFLFRLIFTSLRWLTSMTFQYWLKITFLAFTSPVLSLGYIRKWRLRQRMPDQRVVGKLIEILVKGSFWDLRRVYVGYGGIWENNWLQHVYWVLLILSIFCSKKSLL